jgi:hypothetical protein
MQIISYLPKLRSIAFAISLLSHIRLVCHLRSNQRRNKFFLTRKIVGSRVATTMSS